MDRRRFVPSPDGLEGRQLLTSSAFGSSKNSLNNPAVDVPVTFRQKELRIEHLPFYLGTLQHDRFFSKPGLEKLQADLNSVVGELHKPAFPRLVAFNTHLRPILPKNNLTAQDAHTLSRDFGNVLETTGATPAQTANLVDDMNALAKIDAESRQPVYLATNDYSLVLQTILGIGRPIQTPTAPVIAVADGVRSQPGFATTHKTQPRLVGTYGVGDTVGEFAGDPTGGFNSAGVTMKLIDDAGRVYGQSVVANQTGDYVVKVDRPLADGVYKFRIVAVDAEGHFSPPSEPYYVKIVTHRGVQSRTIIGADTPQGPLVRK